MGGGLSIADVQEKLTHREYLTRLSWIEDEEYDRVTKTEHYLMQIAMEIRRVLHSSPNSIQLNEFEIDFVKQDGEQQKASEEQKLASSKAVWFGRVGYKKDE